MKASYNIYWSAKGDYGKERVRRSEARKKKRKEKDNRNCPTCYSPSDLGQHICPCDEEFGYIRYCNCCTRCTRDCAESI